MARPTAARRGDVVESGILQQPNPFTVSSVNVYRKHVAWYTMEAALFETLRTMSGVWPFKLVFLFEVPDFSQGEVQEKLARGSNRITAEGHLDFLGLRCIVTPGVTGDFPLLVRP